MDMSNQLVIYCLRGSLASNGSTVLTIIAKNNSRGVYELGGDYYTQIINASNKYK